MSTTENTPNEKPFENIVDRDVLGQEKPPVNAPMPKANPNRIFIALAFVIVAIILYWFLKH
jgi:hypothetical protein